MVNFIRSRLTIWLMRFFSHNSFCLLLNSSVHSFCSSLSIHFSVHYFLFFTFCSLLSIPFVHFFRSTRSIHPFLYVIQFTSETEPNSNALRQFNFNYRDRAKERRQKYGQSDQPEVPSSRYKEKYMRGIKNVLQTEDHSSRYETDSQGSSLQNSIGAKLLKNMGWSDGQGLGRSNQGRSLTGLLSNFVRRQDNCLTAGLSLLSFVIDFKRSPFKR